MPPWGLGMPWASLPCSCGWEQLWWFFLGCALFCCGLWMWTAVPASSFSTLGLTPMQVHSNQWSLNREVHWTLKCAHAWVSHLDRCMCMLACCAWFWLWLVWVMILLSVDSDNEWRLSIKPQAMPLLFLFTPLPSQHHNKQHSLCIKQELRLSSVHLINQYAVAVYWIITWSQCDLSCQNMQICCKLSDLSCTLTASLCDSRNGTHHSCAVVRNLQTWTCDQDLDQGNAVWKQSMWSSAYAYTA